MLFFQDRFPEAKYLNEQYEHLNSDSWTQFQGYWSRIFDKKADPEILHIKFIIIKTF